MDKGNHYQKCDLQIHTPRDRGWKVGSRAGAGRVLELTISQ